MDSDDELEMADALLTAHATATALLDEHLAVLTCLLGLVGQINTAPRIGGSKPERRKNKDRNRMENHMTSGARMEGHIGNEIGRQPLYDGRKQLLC